MAHATRCQSCTIDILVDEAILPTHYWEQIDVKQPGRGFQCVRPPPPLGRDDLHFHWEGLEAEAV